MKSQWMLLLGFVFALIIAIFAIVNVRSVEFNYLFGTTHTPLILIILISTLFGGLTVGFLGMFRIYVLSKKVKHYDKEWKQRGLDPLPETGSIFKKKTKKISDPELTEELTTSRPYTTNDNELRSND